LNIDGRRLLSSAAAVPTAAVLSVVKRADAAAADVLQSSPLTHHARIIHTK
jgi:hypothetical protein